MKMLKTLLMALLMAFPGLAQVPNPQIPLTGTAGAAGNFPLLNSGTFAIPSDANFTPTFPNTTCIVCKVTSSVSLTATRNLIEPTAAMTFNITNATTGGQSILVKAATGTGVTIANGVSKWVWFDGTNYVEIDPPGSGSSLPTASAPGQIISSTAAGTGYAVQPQIFYNQTGDTIASIESECSSLCTYVVTVPQTITLTGNHTLNANISLRFEKGGIWTINGASDVLTIGSGKVEVPTPHIIFAVAGTATVAGLADSYPDWFGGVMSQSDEALRKAVAATGDGSTFRGIIHFRATQYWSDYCAEATNPFSKNYITFAGAGKPSISLTHDQLVPASGTILVGCLQPDSSGLSIGLHLADLGIDRGFTVDATYFAGAQENSFIMTTWSGNLSSPYADDFQVNNVVALDYDTSGIRHAFAFEHASNGNIHGLYTYGGNFGVVNKSLNMQGEDIHIEAANTSFIFKSDNTRSFGSWTNFSNIYISDGLLGDGSGDHLGVIGLQVPGNLNNTWTGLNISNANIQGQSDAIEVDGDSTGIHLSGVTMDNIGNFCLKSTGGAITDFSLRGWTCTRYNASGGGNPAISLASNFANPILSDGYMSSAANVIAIDNFSANATLSNITVQASGSAGFGIFGETSSFAHVTHFKANGVVAETAGATADIAFDIEALNRTDLNQQTLGNAALLGVGDGAARGWLDYAAADTLSLRSMGSTTGTPGSIVFRNFSSDLSVGGIVLTISPFGNLSGPGTVAMTGQIDSNTGFEVGGLAPSGHCLLGNGTNYVDGICPGLVNPMTTLGDIITGGASGSPGRLGIGSTNQVLTVIGGVPAWATAAGGGNVSTSGSPTTGFVPLWASGTTIGNSLLDYGVTTASKFTMAAGLNITDASGLGGGFDNLEGTAHTGASGTDDIWADSTAHRWKMNNNNAGALILSGIASAGTSGHCVQLATNGIDLADSGSACGSGSSAFSAITSGTNTTAAMVVGAGGSLNFTSTGTINASTLLGNTWASPGTIGGTTPGAITGTTIVANSGYLGTTGGVTSSGTANSGANFNSGAFQMFGSIWNGTAAVNDIWQFQNVVGTGTNPTSTLSIGQTGSSGVANVLVPALRITGIGGSTQCVQADTNGNLSGTGSTCGSGGGSVTSVSGDGTLITNSSSTGGVTLTLGTAAAHKFFGNNTGSTAAPGYQSIGVSDWTINSYVAGAGSVNVLTATMSPAATALTTGLQVWVLPNLANTTTTPTLNVNGLGAVTITKSIAGIISAIVANDYVTTLAAHFFYDGTEWVLLNPQTVSAGGTTWNAITNPTGNLSLAMAANLTTMTWNQTSGTSTDYLITDTASNAATGVLLKVATAASSTEVPFEVDHQGSVSLKILPGGDFLINTSTDCFSPVCVSGTLQGNVINAQATAANSVINELQITNNATGVGTGTALSFVANNSATTQKTWANIFAIETTNTSGSEVGDLAWKTINAGTLAEKMRLTGAGDLNIEFGHLTFAQTTPPAVTSCGGGTIGTGSTDNAFFVTGITAATSCTVTFNKALKVGACSANTSTGIATGAPPSTTVAVFAMAALTGSLTAVCF